MKQKKKRKQNIQLKEIQKKMIAVLAVLAALILLLTGYALFFEAKPPSGGGEITAVLSEQPEAKRQYHVTSTEIETAGEIPVQHVYIPWGSPRRPGEIREIRYITIHETDNRRGGADALAHSTLLTTDTSDITGWHYTVDGSSVYHNIPDNEIAWNAGDNRSRDGGNINGIGIEMCVNVSNDFEQTLRNTAELAAALMSVYDLDMDHVKFHEDFMNKECPHRLITEGRTEEFLQMIRDAYARQKDAVTKTESEAQ